MDSEYAKGHRSRLKEKFKMGGLSQDYELLELLLTYSIPRRDVKPTAKRLLSRFKSTENIFAATPEELAGVDGIGESTAFLISLVAEADRRAFEDGGGVKETLNSASQTISYCSSAIENCEEGTILMITLNNSGCAITCSDVTAEYEEYSESGSLKPFGDILLRDSASGVIFAQKTGRSIFPSSSVISFIIRINAFFKSINAHLEDFIIIDASGFAFSVRSSDRFNKYF